ncbi:hypothetical protein TGAM01_v205586, partial [Trichoderma gamsii]
FASDARLHYVDFRGLHQQIRLESRVETAPNLA